MGRTRRIRRRKLDKDDGDDEYPIVELCKYLGSLGWRNETKLSQKNFEGTGRGLRSKRNLVEGDLLIQIPVEALIGIHTIENDTGFRDILTLHLNNLKEQEIDFQGLLSFYILFHKHRASSTLKPYLGTIPTEFTNPFFCAKKELYYLPEDILRIIVEQNEKVKSSYNVFQELLRDSNCDRCARPYFPEIFSVDDFKWAYFAVNSRCVYVDLNALPPLKGDFDLMKFIKKQPSFALAPFLDLLNHSDSAKTSPKLIRNENGFVYQLYTYKSFRKYEQIFISYGDLPNFKLLLDYGFFIKDNAHDFFEFNLSDIEAIIKTNSILNARDIHRNKFKFIKDHNLDQQMFVHKTDGLSHNLKVTLYLIFKEKSHFTNVLNQTAFGADDLFANSLVQEGRVLLEFKISEYEEYAKGLHTIQDLSDSGIQCLGYIEECISYLKDCLNKFL